MRRTSMSIPALLTLLASAALAATGCIRSPTFHCEQDEQCKGDGMCLGGYCAFPGDCGSGWRYDDSAGDLAGTCVGSTPDGGPVDGGDAAIDGNSEPFVRDVCLEGPAMPHGDACVEAVCADEARCCDMEWSDACVHLAGRLCRTAALGEHTCRADVAVGGDGDIGLLRFDPADLTQTPTSTVPVGLGDWTLDLDWSDYDGDGDVDLAVASQGLVRIFDGKPPSGGALRFDAPFRYPEQSQGEVWGGATFGDQDGDGVQEVVFTTTVLGVVVLRREGAGWTPTPVWAPEPTDAGVANSIFADWIQLDGDPGLELVVGTGSTLMTFDHDGDHWTLTDTVDVPEQNFGDVDAAWDRVAVTSFPGTVVFGSDGDHHLVDQHVNVSGATAVSWADLDNDGELDLAIGGANFLYVYRGNAGGFNEITPIEPNFSNFGNIQDIDVGDVDGDGMVDIAVQPQGGPTEIWVNRLDEASPAFRFSLVNTVDFNLGQLSEVECLAPPAALADAAP